MILFKAFYLLFIQEFLEEAFAIVYKHFGNLIAVGFLVGACMYFAVVKAKYLSIGNTQQNRRMCSYNELRAIICAFVYLRQQCQLPLRRKGCLRLVEQIQAV